MSNTDRVANLSKVGNPMAYSRNPDRPPVNKSGSSKYGAITAEFLSWPFSKTLRLAYYIYSGLIYTPSIIYPKKRGCLKRNISRKVRKEAKNAKK
ncbi:MAG: hypothetical protein JWM28_17 [Chitinophagaceae bacterium]|nr:hypothetical protein [Chitinophagaceae bacterium]